MASLGGTAGISSKAPKIVFNERERAPDGPLPLGKVLATPAALKLLLEAGEHPFDYLARHATGDWGDLCEDDRQENERSLEHGWRIVSSYSIGGKTIWIITEADRSVTTILLPEDY